MKCPSLPGRALGDRSTTRKATRNGWQRPALALAVALCCWLATACTAPVDGENVAALAQDIIGGGPATPGQWPWMAWIGTPDYPFNCGATVLSSEWVLTANHCTRTHFFQNPLPASDFTITVGDFDRDVSEGTEQTSQVDVVQRNAYGTGASGPQDYDTALLHLTTPLTWTPFVQPIRPAVGADGGGVGVVELGWGVTVRNPDENTPASSTLMQASSSVIDNPSCVIPGERALAFDEICAGVSDGSVGTCHGDSGGPMMTQRFGGTWEQLGITSWGDVGCNSFGVDARVSSHVGWIRKFVYDVATLPSTISTLL